MVNKRKEPIYIAAKNSRLFSNFIVLSKANKPLLMEPLINFISPKLIEITPTNIWGIDASRQKSYLRIAAITCISEISSMKFKEFGFEVWEFTIQAGERSYSVTSRSKTQVEADFQTLLKLISEA